MHARVAADALVTPVALQRFRLGGAAGPQAAVSPDRSKRRRLGAQPAASPATLAAEPQGDQPKQLSSRPQQQSPSVLPSVLPHVKREQGADVSEQLPHVKREPAVPGTEQQEDVKPFSGTTPTGAATPSKPKQSRPQKVPPRLKPGIGVPEALGDQPLRLIIVGSNPSDHAWCAWQPPL